jgi:hypothetical protein
VATGVRLTVDATVRSATASEFVIDEAVAPFLGDVSVVEGTRISAATRHGARIHVPCAAVCRLRYELRLGDAGAALANPEVALAAGSAVFAPIAAWLVHPEDTPESGRYRLRVVSDPPIRFVTGVRPTGRLADTYEGPLASFRDSTFSGFGALRVQSVAGGKVIVAAAPGAGPSDAEIARWITAETSALTSYLGGFPEDRVVVFVVPGTSSSMRGVTLGGGGASVLLRLPAGAVSIDLVGEWVAAHELLHVVFPQVEGGHTWFSEGWASYVEPFARARAGMLPPEKVWADLVDGLPLGLPGPADRGLDEDDSWGRTYWGGSLFFFLADVQIREASHGTRSLEDVAVAIAREAGNVETTWPIERVLAVGDRATSGHVLADLYARLAHARGDVDLAGLLGRLGVRRSAHAAQTEQAGQAGQGESPGLADAAVEFDERAELSGIRRSMTLVSSSAPRAGILSPTTQEK